MLSAPEAAARAAAQSSAKQRSSAEEAIAQAVSAALHLLGALKQALPGVAQAAAIGICDLLFKLYPLKQALLSRHATEALAVLCSAPSSQLSPQALAHLLGAVLDQVTRRPRPRSSIHNTSITVQM